MIEIDFTLNGTTIPIFAFDVTGNAHGATGSASVNTSIKMLDQAMPGLTSTSVDSEPLPASITTSDDAHGSMQIFNGTYAVGKWNYTDDTVMLQLRDAAGTSMVDQKRVNVEGSDSGDQGPGEASGGSGVKTQNNKLSGFVSQIAQQMGLSPMLGLSDDPLIGTIFGDSTDTIQLSTPNTYWGFLTRLARDTGNIMYATPQKQLFFGSEGTGPALNLAWRVPILGGSLINLLTLDVEHNPARNASHKTTVNSYDPTTGKTTSGTKSARGGKAKYTFHVDGLTAAQAQKRAESTSKDISRREVIVTGGIDYNPTIIGGGMPATLTGQVDPMFSGYQLYVSAYTHGFRMSKGKTAGDIYTNLTLLKQGDK